MTPNRIASIRAIADAHPGHLSAALIHECLDEIEKLQRPAELITPADVSSTDIATRLETIFHRQPTTHWLEKEVKALKKIVVHENDLALVERYYGSNWPPRVGKNSLRHDLFTFLNNYPGEVDRARAWCELHPLAGMRKAKASGHVDRRTPEQIEATRVKAAEMVDGLRRQFQMP